MRISIVLSRVSYARKLLEIFTRSMACRFLAIWSSQSCSVMASSEFWFRRSSSRTRNQNTSSSNNLRIEEQSWLIFCMSEKRFRNYLTFFYNWNTLNVCVRISPGLHKLLTMKKFKWEVIFKFDTQIIQMQFQNTPTSFLSKMSNDSQFCKIRN